MARVCAFCGATSKQRPFPGKRKPSRARDYCCSCTEGLARLAKIADELRRTAGAAKAAMAAGSHTTVRP